MSSTSQRRRPEPYIPDIGRAVVKPRLEGKGRVINLSLNESSYGASPRAVAAAQERCQRLNRYPDVASTELRRAIGAHFGLDPDRIVCGNGSEELIDIIARLYARPGDEILFTEFGFIQFPIVTMRVGATAVRAPAPNQTADVDALIERITERTRIIYLDNPNNPCGTYIPADEVRRLRDNVPSHVVLVIDSAYADFVDARDYTDGIELVEGFENVIVTRTFSKAWGLAALRVGWAYTSLSMARVMNRMRGIGNVNAIAQATVLAALEDPDFVRGVREKTAAERARMTEALGRMGLHVTPSVTNFLMIRFPSDTNRRASAALAHLAEHGIIVRAAEDYGLPDSLRITIGDTSENDKVLAALESFMV
ncbi:MAG TPA: histidinol-phosphate transaminase [Alphaproteobacteria bacterium]